MLISFLALSGPPWLGILFGAVELLTAWRVTPPTRARVLRGITPVIGAFTLVYSVVLVLA